jgi:hypothetical protein
MGSIINKSFFSVDITHDFYTSGLSNDFSIAPTVKTRAKILDQKLIFRALPSGLRMFYRAESEISTTPFLPIVDGLYSFALTLNNKLEFSNVTNLDDGSNKYASGKIAYFRNTNTSVNTLTYELLNRLMPEQFSYDLTISALITDTVVLQIKDAFDTTVVVASIPTVRDDAGNYHAVVDLRNFDPGKYVIHQLKNTVSQASEKIYVNGSIIGKDVFGILDIELKTTSITFAQFVALGTFNSLTGPTALFTRRLSKWRYFIVNKTGNEVLNSTPISDQSSADSVYSVYSFDAPQTGLTFNGFPTTSILSSSTIPFFERSKLKLELRRVNNSAIIANLPNPTRNAISAETVVVNTPDITQIFVFI